MLPEREAPVTSLVQPNFAPFPSLNPAAHTTRHLEPVASRALLKYSVLKAANYCWEDPKPK